MLVPFDLRNKSSLSCRLAQLGPAVNISFYLSLGFPSEHFPVEIYFNNSFGNFVICFGNSEGRLRKPVEFMDRRPFFFLHIPFFKEPFVSLTSGIFSIKHSSRASWLRLWGLSSICEVLSSDLGLETDCPECGFLELVQSLHACTRII